MPTSATSTSSAPSGGKGAPRPVGTASAGPASGSMAKPPLGKALADKGPVATPPDAPAARSTIIPEVPVTTSTYDTPDIPSWPRSSFVPKVSLWMMAAGLTLVSAAALGIGFWGTSDRDKQGVDNGGFAESTTTPPDRPRHTPTYVEPAIRPAPALVESPHAVAVSNQPVLPGPATPTPHNPFGVQAAAFQHESHSHRGAWLAGIIEEGEPITPVSATVPAGYSPNSGYSPY